MPTLTARADAAMTRLHCAIAELEAAALAVDPTSPWTHITPDERDVLIAEQVAEAAEQGVAALWHSIGQRAQAETRRAAA
jgi:hypothetical protein